MTIESNDIQFLKDAVAELLRRVPGVVAVTTPAVQEPNVEYWPSAIEGQKIPKITGNLSVDVVVAMLGGVKPNTPERDAELRAGDAALAATVYKGHFPAANFMLGPREGREAAFIYAASRIYREKQDAKGIRNADLYRDCGLFSGTYSAIALLIGYGEQEQIFEHKTYEQTVADFPDTPVKRVVMAAVEA